MVKLSSAPVTLGQKQGNCFLFHLAFRSRATLMLDYGSLYFVGSCIAGLLFSFYSFVQLSSRMYVLRMW